MTEEPTIVSFVGPEAAPPAWAIEQAELAANRSPCQKRKVGISVYQAIGQLSGGREMADYTSASGYNGPPWAPDAEYCDGSEACRRDCARRCVHAEPRAIAAVPAYLRERFHNLRLVHVKLDDAGKVKPCDGPSCDSCSKHILDAGIGGIWLYERGQYQQHPTESNPRLPPRWIYYPAREFHEATLDALGIYRIPTRSTR